MSLTVADILNLDPMTTSLHLNTTDAGNNRFPGAYGSSMAVEVAATLTNLRHSPLPCGKTTTRAELASVKGQPGLLHFPVPADGTPSDDANRFCD